MGLQLVPLKLPHSSLLPSPLLGGRVQRSTSGSDLDLATYRLLAFGKFFNPESLRFLTTLPQNGNYYSAHVVLLHGGNLA